MDKEHVIYKYNGVLCSLKKENDSAIWYYIMLSEKSQSQKVKYVWFHLYEWPKVVKLTKTESGRVDACQEVRTGRGLVFNEHRVSV